MNIKDAKHIHFIGIGGIGISALAKTLLHQGKQVSGINDSQSPETLDELREQRVDISILTTRSHPSSASSGEERPLAFAEDIDIFVYSVAWEGTAPEALEAARATDKPVLTYFEALGSVAKDYKVIAISGTHGKTTTTAMTARALIAVGLDPTIIVGSLVDFGDGRRTNFHASRDVVPQLAEQSGAMGGGTSLLIVEACEYKRHFLYFNPYILAVTNIEFDHPDYYKDLADTEDAFVELASQSEIVLAQESIENHMLSVPELKVLGDHNRCNASLALAIVDALVVDLPDRQVALEKARDALEELSGSWRRFEYKGITTNGAKVYDDYAHHPTSIKATLAAASEACAGGKIIAVFESHMYSRTKEFWSDFATAFTDADEVIIAPIYPAREELIEGVTAEALAQAIAKHNPNTESTKTLRQASQLASQLAGKGDTIIFMSAGDIFQQIPKILQES